MSVCAVVAASDFNADEFREMHEAGAFDYVIAVDAGYEHLQALDIKPDLVMGDFDSLGYVPKGIRTSRFPEHKDESDTELALERAKTLRHTHIYVFGALGGRLDHTLANMQVMTKFSEMGIHVVAIDIESAVFFVTGPDILEMEARTSGIVSVFAMNDEVAGLFERGLEWELDDATLSNRTSRGLSNQCKGEPIMVGVETGTIAVFFPL